MNHFNHILGYYNGKNHKEIVDEIIDNVNEGYDVSLMILNYATFLYVNNNDTEVHLHDWVEKIKSEVESKTSEEF
jgi:hypothetical protein